MPEKVAKLGNGPTNVVVLINFPSAVFCQTTADLVAAH